MVVSKCLSLTLHVPTHPSTPFLTPPSKKTPTLSYSFTHFSFQTKLNKAFPTSYNHSLTKHFPMKCSNSSSSLSFCSPSLAKAEYPQIALYSTLLISVSTTSIFLLIQNLPTLVLSSFSNNPELSS